MIKPPRPKFPWTPEACAQLMHLWNNTRIPCKRIGEIVGCGKNAAIGKAHRLGCNKRGDPIIRYDSKLSKTGRSKHLHDPVSVKKEPKPVIRPFYIDSKLVNTKAPVGQLTYKTVNRWPYSERCLHPECKHLGLPLYCYSHAYVKGLRTARAA